MKLSRLNCAGFPGWVGDECLLSNAILSNVNCKHYGSTSSGIVFWYFDRNVKQVMWNLWYTHIGWYYSIVSSDHNFTGSWIWCMINAGIDLTLSYTLQLMTGARYAKNNNKKTSYTVTTKLPLKTVTYLVITCVWISGPYMVKQYLHMDMTFYGSVHDRNQYSRWKPVAISVLNCFAARYPVSLGDTF